MRKYIIFQAEKSDKTNWRNRKLQHTQALTWILAEHWDSSDKPIPEPGYRPTEFIRVDQLHDPKEHGHSTHYRKGDWEVTRVETYTPDLPLGDYDMVVICYCKYNPINAPLKPMPERQVSLASFGGDETAYQQWLESQKETADV
ncbi:MAG: hypothetical protein B0A82_13210 [Alkalinema sp. CACIAM 70d]|nr:MAG: hypothetical protein B0A82_13210 [Alkalinema sp. CACIAM 70d]